MTDIDWAEQQPGVRRVPATGDLECYVATLHDKRKPYTERWSCDHDTHETWAEAEGCALLEQKHRTGAELGLDRPGRLVLTARRHFVTESWDLDLHAILDALGAELPEGAQLEAGLISVEGDPKIMQIRARYER